MGVRWGDREGGDGTTGLGLQDEVAMPLLLGRCMGESGLNYVPGISAVTIAGRGKSRAL